MKVSFLSLLLLCTAHLSLKAQITPFEKSGKKETATYKECISFYEQLDREQGQVKMIAYGQTDVGFPLHVVVIDKDGLFNPEQVKSKNKTVLLINNGIHPGEPEGIDASMVLARELVKKNQIPANVTICIIPVYNIDGALNRGTSRINQDGPLSYGFRGNYQNLDLNRDFIKSDSKNSLTFQQIFTTWQPDVFVDTHVSNGADYQYIMTLIATQKDKIHPAIADYMQKQLEPALYRNMDKAGFEMTPYVNSLTELPDSGIVGFLETPRYASGYAALHHTIGFITETHMLKSFEKREAATYAFLEIMIKQMQKDYSLILSTRKKAITQILAQQNFPLNWKVNMDKSQKLTFKGYTATYKKSEVSGKDRLFYDHNKPYSKQINFWNDFDPVDVIEKPKAYVIPQSWAKVIGLLKLNKVIMSQLKNDTTLFVEIYYLDDFSTNTRPYEGHYNHSKVKLRKEKMQVKYYTGDFLVYTNQPQNRYIIETLEPQAVDSYFNWNFFDSILGQKEYFSSYVFEDVAAAMLKKDAKLKADFETAKAADTELAGNAQAQLNWIYIHSPYYEKSYRRYPVGRLLDEK